MTLSIIYNNLGFFINEQKPINVYYFSELEEHFFTENINV